MPKSRATVCAGTCGPVKNQQTCGKTVDCGACTCATGCPDCQTCNPDTGLCDAVANGTPCDDGDACIINDVCTGGECVGSPKCPSPQGCEGGTCCSTAGNVATSETPCCSGLSECTDGVCRADCCAEVTCSACLTCEGGACVADATQEGEACGTCQVCNAASACVPAPPGSPCGTPSDNLVCLDSGECGVVTCSDVVACPAGCQCSGPTSPSRCYQLANFCAPTNQLCDSGTCPQGFQCLPCMGGSRCNPLCTG
jgi:hypothetical protein